MAHPGQEIAFCLAAFLGKFRFAHFRQFGFLLAQVPHVLGYGIFIPVFYADTGNFRGYLFPVQFLVQPLKIGITFFQYFPYKFIAFLF